MTARAARIEAERRAAETSLIVFQTLKMLGLLNTMLSQRECIRRYGEWFKAAVREEKIIGVRHGNRILYKIEDILALQSLELQCAKEQAEDYLV